MWKTNCTNGLCTSPRQTSKINKRKRGMGKNCIELVLLVTNCVEVEFLEGTNCGWLNEESKLG